MTTIFDIETGPASDAVLEQVKPVFEANKTLKDPDKIVADIAQKEASWRERVALDAKTGQVLAIGLLDDETHILSGTEASILHSLWDLWDDGPKLVGFCIKSFDLPFVIQRSWILGVAVPKDLIEGRYFSRRVVDLQEVWTCFNYRTEGQSLDAVCRACGLGGKSGNGKDFARLWAEDRKAALDYLGRDLELSAQLAERLGVR